MSEIIKNSNWNKNKLSIEHEDVSLKFLERKASSFHNEVERINETILKGKYVIKTVIKKKENKKYYKLFTKIKYYGNESKNEHKKNSHRQEIDI